VDVAGGREDDAAVRQERGLAVGHGQRLAVLHERESELLHLPRREVHRVEIVGIGVEIVAHGKHQRLGVPRETRIADRAFGLLQQHLVLGRAVLPQRRQTELAAPLEPVGEVADLLVGDVVLSGQSLQAAHDPVLGVDELRRAGANRR